MAGATRLVDVCLEAGLNMFGSADIYSDGLAEEILGKAITGRRERVILSTKGGQRAGAGPNDVTINPGSSRSGFGTGRAELVARRAWGRQPADGTTAIGLPWVAPDRGWNGVEVGDGRAVVLAAVQRAIHIIAHVGQRFRDLVGGHGRDGEAILTQAPAGR